MLGSDDAGECYDNERPRHAARIEAFYMDRAPATVAAFAEFVAARGYGDERLWSSDGWRWRVTNEVFAPLGWVRDAEDRWLHPDGAAAGSLPVTGVSCFEAEAFARFRGARLPTEAEWEHAAGPQRFPTGERAPTTTEANIAAARAGLSPSGAFAQSRGLCDLAGNVWEWTASAFAPYAGFRAYPYDGYSTPWFHTHRVLRGGSWATSGRLCRRSFRNWYEPGFRALPAGVRCAGDAT
jgi:iron(II)-dependent oxidoreductase